VTLEARIKERAIEAGFDLAGVAPLAAWRDLEFAQNWSAQGYGGEMTYLKNPRRADPHLILSSVKSIVCVGLVYNAPLPYSTDVSRQLSVDSPRPTADSPSADSRLPTPDPRAWISRYAWGRDYHKLMRVDTRVYVDTGPIPERAFARLSGIGWTGKNTCLINQQKGSWFFIGVILTNLDLEPDVPAFDRCGSCRRCLDACPTGALVEPYVMDASRCIAYFNIELKGSIPAEFRPAIGANVFGCDIC
jgi:epoxyqueuosine reductase